MLKKIALLVIFMLTCCGVSFADTQTLALIKELEGKLSGVKTLETDFIQKKKMAIFAKPVILEGKVFIQEPDLFAWHTNKPVRYIMVIKGDLIKQWDQDSRQMQVLSLARNPTFSVAINQMKVWFKGNYSSLLNEYEIKVIGRNPVILEFTPKENAPAASLINKVNITFQNDERYIKKIAIVEKNQDTTELAFTNTKLNNPINPSNWELK
ncbi:MAG TPA: outer membrane lipoprotein carrier protein LolA [Candidatus Omnitrophota bacterium]|nr:outer membrane lipoprotein carrier protein LolA [Candidatus Omnitrophota bacterium]HPT39840.1 outer membrane lipoprotein carrier protein LolA [Candidatus Omnitrophota bacterium]